MNGPKHQIPCHMHQIVNSVTQAMLFPSLPAAHPPYASKDPCIIIRFDTHHSTTFHVLA